MRARDYRHCPPFHKLPLEGRNLGNLTHEERTECAWYVIDQHYSTEVKVAMLYDGRHTFLKRAKKAFGPFGLDQEDAVELWRRLNVAIPHVAQILKPTLVS